MSGNGEEISQITKVLASADVKVNIVLYNAVSSPFGPLNALYTCCPLGRPVHSDTDSASPGSILAMQQLRNMTK